MNVRVKFFLGHLSISAIIAVCTLLLIFRFWYPVPLYSAVGVTKIFLILLAVDMSLGPLLTLIIAAPSKSRRALRFDLFIIGLVQLSALMYGIYKIELGRPIWIAFDTFRFEIVQAAMIDYSELNKDEFYNAQPLFSKPNWVAIVPPQSVQEKNERLFYELEQGVAPSGRPIFYQDMDLAWAKIKQEAHSLANLSQYNPQSVVATILADYKEADAYLPLLAPQIDMTVLLNTRQEEIMGIVDLRPW